MHDETLLKTIEELIEENKKLKLLNKVLITGIKDMHDNAFTNLPSLERMAYVEVIGNIYENKELLNEQSCNSNTK